MLINLRPPKLNTILSVIFSKASDQMSYFERIENILLLLCQRLFLPYNSKALTSLSKKFPTKYRIIDPLKYLSQKISAYFINVNEFTETARPVLRNFVDVGGLMVDSKQSALTKVTRNFRKFEFKLYRFRIMKAFTLPAPLG